MNKMNPAKNYSIKCPEFGEDVLDEYPQANTECRFLVDYQSECNYEKYICIHTKITKNRMLC